MPTSTKVTRVRSHAGNSEKIDSVLGGFRDDDTLSSGLPPRYHHKASAWSKVWKTLLILIVFIGGGYAYLHYIGSRDPGEGTNSTPPPSTAGDTAPSAEQEKIQALVAEVGALTTLPSDESPLVFDINDPQGLAERRPFFAGSVVGDKLLLYQRSNVALVYSPSRKQVVKQGTMTEYMATVELADTPPAPPPVAAPVPATTLTVEVRNGTNVAGLAKKTGDTLAKNTAYKITKVGNAARTDFSETVVYVKNVSLSAEKRVQDIAASVGGKVVTVFPGGESSTTADVLVVLGRE